MNRVTKSFLGSLLMSGGLLLQACSPAGVPGNGQIVTDDRPATGFTRLDTETSIPVNVRQGSAFSVTVTLDSNLQGLVQTSVAGDTLVISETRPYDSSGEAVVEIAMPALAGVEGRGSGDMTVAGFSGAGALALADSGSGSLFFDGACGPLAADVSGSGSMRLTGQGGHVTATADGSGSLDASGLVAGDGAEIVVSGSGDAAVAVLGDASLSTSGSGSITGTLNAGKASFSVSGSGSIAWSGDDQIGDVSTSGSGSIARY